MGGFNHDKWGFHYPQWWFICWIEAPEIGGFVNINKSGLFNQHTPGGLQLGIIWIYGRCAPIHILVQIAICHIDNIDTRGVYTPGHLIMETPTIQKGANQGIRWGMFRLLMFNYQRGHHVWKKRFLFWWHSLIQTHLRWIGITYPVFVQTKPPFGWWISGTSPQWRSNDWYPIIDDDDLTSVDGPKWFLYDPMYMYIIVYL